MMMRMATQVRHCTTGAMRQHLGEGIPKVLPPAYKVNPDVDHVPARKQILKGSEKELALRNALRYFPEEWHGELAAEFAEELRTYGRIYMMRFKPTEYEFRAYNSKDYPAKDGKIKALLTMIHNNLDPAVAQFPEELITYGGNGATFQNWAQYRLTMKYLCEMEADQTLVMYSGHPHGVFPSHAEAPRLVITNGMVIPNYSSQDDYERMNALGVSQYGQMTAGSFMYIGPQGIVHGTTITVMNAARKYLNRDSCAGVKFITSGLGGMSGAQPKACMIAGVATIVAEVNPVAAKKRFEQGWCTHLTEDVDEAIDLMEAAAAKGEAVAVGYIGNVVEVFKRVDERGVEVHLGSDQTSLHNPWAGGYYPHGTSFEESKVLMSQQPEEFKAKVKESLRVHADYVNRLSKKGMHFWDYGNAFLLEASRAGADIMKEDGTGFIYPSYVEDIMGPMCFDYGFGPYRWVCSSCDPADLLVTDKLAAEVLAEQMEESPPEIQQQITDNIRWIEGATENKLVVGSQARILYADDVGRRRLASAFNRAVKDGRITAPVVLGRDHHDVSGTDSPYRETANIRDGSMFCADMAVQNFVGDSFRGATWVSLHNGGGVGWGEVMNGGFGMVLDGSDEAERNLQSMLHWDVNNGIARRAWARNSGAEFAAKRAMEANVKLHITVCFLVCEGLFVRLSTTTTDAQPRQGRRDQGRACVNTPADQDRTPFASLRRTASPVHGQMILSSSVHVACAYPGSEPVSFSAGSPHVERCSASLQADPAFYSSACFALRFVVVADETPPETAGSLGGRAPDDNIRVRFWSVFVLPPRLRLLLLNPFISPPFSFGFARTRWLLCTATLRPPPPSTYCEPRSILTPLHLPASCSTPVKPAWQP